LALQPDNAARARRGLLPRKVVRTQAPRARRIVRTQAPTWLGEPGGAAVVVAPAVDAGPEAATAIEPAEAPDPTWPIRAAADAVAVEWRVVRHAAAGDTPHPLRATVSAPDVELVVMRRRPPPR
jgi:hypothetical protein